MQRKLLYTFLIALVCFGLIRLYHALTDDFRLGNITHELPYQEAWAIAPLSPSQEKQVQDILSQTFIYLDKGSQSYAFVSEDGNYVLKFFKFKHLRPAPILDWASSMGLFQDYHAKLTARKQRKLWGVFRAYKLAYDQDKDESGLIFIQLNTKGNPARSVTVRDKIGLTHIIDLTEITFILQYRGETLRAVLNKILQKGDVATAKKRLGQILDLYAAEYSRGMYDHDHGVMRNVGFVGERPIHLDVGKLSPEIQMKQKKRAKEDALLVVDKIKKWTKRNYPDYSTDINQFLNHKVHQLYD